MKTRIIILAGLVLIAGSLLYYHERRMQKAEVSDLTESWVIFDQYRSAVKAGDLAALKAVSYQLSPACQDEARTAECQELMSGIYGYIKDYRQEEFHLLAWDKRQMILVSDYFYWLEGDAPSATRAALYFVKDKGAMKILSINPIQGTIILRGDQATSTVEAIIAEAIDDTDSDGTPDRTEKCEDHTPGVECVPTNPNMKDSDRDGWWDSTEALFNR